MRGRSGDGLDRVDRIDREDRLGTLEGGERLDTHEVNTLEKVR